MILFKDIYEKAIDLFDDPVIKRAYVEDKVRWYKMMYKYLKNGIGMVNNPTSIAYALLDKTEPHGQIDVFTGNGTAVYSVESGFIPEDGCEFSFLINGRCDKGSYQGGVVTFSRPVREDEKCSVEWYAPGMINGDFSDCASSTVSGGVISAILEDILADALVLAWATKEQNIVIEIRNVLQDTDFKLYSPANSIKAKISWLESIRFNFNTQINKLGWNLLSRKYSGGKYYG